MPWFTVSLTQPCAPFSVVSCGERCIVATGEPDAVGSCVVGFVSLVLLGRKSKPLDVLTLAATLPAAPGTPLAFLRLKQLGCFTGCIPAFELNCIERRVVVLAGAAK